MEVRHTVLTGIGLAKSPRLSPVRRFLREAGLEVVRPARKLPRSWQRFVRSKRFARSRLWSRLRYDFLRDQDGRCRCCGHGSADGARLNVDHILSRKAHPQLALAYANLQVLCATCNQGKGNRAQTDWRFRVPTRKRKTKAATVELRRRKRGRHRGHGPARRKCSPTPKRWQRVWPTRRRV